MMTNFLWLFLITTFQVPIEIPFFKESPKIDGVVSEKVWTKAHIYAGYYTQIEPHFGKRIPENTVVRIGYDKNSLYVLFGVYQKKTTFIEKKGTRDKVINQDAIGIIIDPLGNKQEMYAITFGLSGTLYDFRKFRAIGGYVEEDLTWDADVDFAISKRDFGYIVEAQIPFSNFRYSGKEEVIWNINLRRKIECRNTEATFSPLKERSDEGEFESLFPILLKDIKGRTKVDIIPYCIFDAIFDSVSTQHGDIGFDARVPLGATGVANFAVNPDFSQLEGDPLEYDFFCQYPLYYEEYRPFFIEERGVFRTDRDLYYSRTIQNPFIAGRYTYKNPNSQAGIIFAYDEKDTIIGNTDAAASILRYTEQYEKNTAGIMLLDRYDLTNKYNNLVLMTDGNVYLPFDIKLTYQVAGTSIDSSSEDMFSNIGLYHHAFLTYWTTHWIILGNFVGRSPNFRNDLGYVQEVDNNYAGGYFGRRFYFNSNILKEILIAEDFGFTGTWSRFDNYIMSARDSIEYFAKTEITINLFTNSLIFLRYRLQKELWQGYYLERWSYNTYAESKINEYIFLDGGFNGGYLIDFNIATVGRFNVGYGDIRISPFPELTINGGIVVNVFDTDTTKQSLKPSDVENPVYMWRTLGFDVGISYSPTNSLSFKLVAERQIAHFAPGYYYAEEYKTTDDKIFGVIEYKPSIGNVIYLGGRYPGKLLFFKFTHRFRL